MTSAEGPHDSKDKIKNSWLKIEDKVQVSSFSFWKHPKALSNNDNSENIDDGLKY